MNNEPQRIYLPKREEMTNPSLWYNPYSRRLRRLQPRSSVCHFLRSTEYTFPVAINTPWCCFRHCGWPFGLHVGLPIGTMGKSTLISHLPKQWISQENPQIIKSSPPLMHRWKVFPIKSRDASNSVEPISGNYDCRHRKFLCNPLRWKAVNFPIQLSPITYTTKSRDFHAHLKYVCWEFVDSVVRPVVPLTYGSNRVYISYNNTPNRYLSRYIPYSGKYFVARIPICLSRLLRHH